MDHSEEEAEKAAEKEEQAKKEYYQRHTWIQSNLVYAEIMLIQAKFILSIILRKLVTHS